jgi:signal transduction histidine kinase
MLTATVSHDMRTPLNAILGLLMSLDYFIKTNEGKRLLTIINNSAQMLLSLVNDMLDLFQIKNGKFVKKLNSVDIRASLESIMDMFQTAANEKKIVLYYACDYLVPDVLITDEQRVK